MNRLWVASVLWLVAVSQAEHAYVDGIQIPDVPIGKDHHLMVREGEENLVDEFLTSVVMVYEQFVQNITGPNNCTTAIDRLKYK